MDLTYMHLWAAGYDLPPETAVTVAGAKLIVSNTANGLKSYDVSTPRRGKKAARAKRQKGQKP